MCHVLRAAKQRKKVTCARREDQPRKRRILSFSSDISFFLSRVTNFPEGVRGRLLFLSRSRRAGMVAVERRCFGKQPCGRPSFPHCLRRRHAGGVYEYVAFPV